MSELSKRLKENSLTIQNSEEIDHICIEEFINCDFPKECFKEYEKNYSLEDIKNGLYQGPKLLAIIDNKVYVSLYGIKGTNKEVALDRNHSRTSIITEASYGGNRELFFSVIYK